MQMGLLFLDQMWCVMALSTVEKFHVQTHVHSDHMSGFESSKGYQTILCSSGTRALLIKERNADLPYRANLIGLDYGAKTVFRFQRSQPAFKRTHAGCIAGSGRVQWLGARLFWRLRLAVG